MLAVLPPPTKIRSWSRTLERRSSGGHGKNSRRDMSAIPENRSYMRSVDSGSSAIAVPM
jgi:hypothetical protein